MMASYTQGGSCSTNVAAIIPVGGLCAMRTPDSIHCIRMHKACELGKLRSDKNNQ